jgi:hypothetical protein|tara:strand:- start:7595 stop:7936 length:342 start_codon:yes stop_codon:yes gene_type:complete
MANEVKIQKTVFNKEQFDRVIDRTFSTYAQPVEEDQETTVAEFFDLYDKLYFEIPVYGDFQTHEYLVKKSGELADFEKDTEDIQPLLDEISTLREQILEYQNQIIELNKPITQ